MIQQNYSKNSDVMVISDLDGSFLAPITYSFDGALKGLDFLRDRNIEPIFASSKTASEISSIQRKIKSRGLLVCENGGAIVETRPNENSMLKVFGRPRGTWMPQVIKLRKELKFKFWGFSDWSVSMLREQTGLSELSARAAQARNFSEPVVWEDSDTKLDYFKEELERINLVAIEGGQFLSIQGKYDKGLATRWLRSHNANSEGLIIALGDGPNDQTMLSEADIAVVIKSPKSHLLKVDGPMRVIHTDNTGPRGWTEGILEAFFTLSCLSSISLKIA